MTSDSSAMDRCEVLPEHDCVAENDCAICGRRLEIQPIVRLRKSCLRACRTCGSWTYFPRGSAAEQAALHDNAAYFEHPYFALRRVITPAQRRRCSEIFARFSTAMDITSLRGEPLLDIGCDTGLFLKAAEEEFGIVPVGVDVAERSIEVAKAQGIDAHRSRIESAPASLAGFRIATAIDLLEHVPEPASFLRAVQDRLRPGGLFYLETPNVRSAIFTFGRRLSLLTGGRPASLLERLFPPHHIQLFTVEGFRELASAAGWEIVRVGTRVLPASDISASFLARLPIGVLQLCDRMFGTEILIWAVLRRSVGAL
jgi:2-polyprenyl-3-methyl-5-hydroxy-6-metoxy-1,4-benzoquinol methylase